VFHIQKNYHPDKFDLTWNGPIEKKLFWDSNFNHFIQLLD
jgi:hypothetical protein